MYMNSNDGGKLPLTDFDNLRKSIEFRLIVEILRNVFLIPDKVYYNSYSSNAETLEKDFTRLNELNEIDEHIKKS